MTAVVNSSSSVAQISPPRVLPKIENNTDDNVVIEYVYKHMIDVSFGEAVNTCDFFCAALKDEILPRMMDTIKRRDRFDLHIKLSTDIGLKVLGSRVPKLRKEDEMRMCLEAAFIMLMISRPDSADSLIKSKEEMLLKYPEFSGMSEGELRVLISFRNVMVVAMQAICPRYNKNRLLTLVTRIVEGRTKKYITGSGQTDSTSHRVLIYQRESGVNPVPRPKPREGGEGDEDEEEEEDEEQVKFAPTPSLQAKRKKQIDAFVADSSSKRASALNTLRNGSGSKVVNMDENGGPEQLKKPSQRPLPGAVKAETAPRNSKAMERLQSHESQPDVDIFRGPFLNLYSTDAMKRKPSLEAFSSSNDFFTATISRAGSFVARENSEEPLDDEEYNELLSASAIIRSISESGLVVDK
jgi:hypothetical protein